MSVTYASNGVPALSGDLADDRTRTCTFFARAQRDLSRLQAAAGEDGDIAAATSRSLLEIARTVRTRFLELHAESVYDESRTGTAVLWTGRPIDARSSYSRLAELAWAAAAKFPGLAPTRAQMVEESRLAQGDRTGHEIDQGILFGGILAAPRAGRHLMEEMLRPTPQALTALEGFQRTGEVVLTAARLDRRDGIGHITITNGHCLNAEDNQHVADLETLVDLVLLDPNVRVGVLRGGPVTHARYAGRRVFSAGINLKDLRGGRISFVDVLLRRELGYLSKMMRGLSVRTAWSASRTQKPWLAAVDTFAVGGGAQILLACDRVVAANDAYFSLPAAHEGIIPGAASLRLTRFLGARQARQVILGGHKVWARDSHARLLFDDVVAPMDMDGAVDAAAAELDNPAVVANRRMLGLAEESEEAGRRYLAEFAVQQALRVYGRDVWERLRHR